MRAFIAIDLPKDLKEEIKSIQDVLKETDVNFRWVNPANIHLTLKFLGNIEKDQVEKIKTILTSVSKNFSSFKSEFTEFGFFPNEKKPRVFFIATSQEDTLKSVATNLQEELEKIGFEKEGKFKSHITLARIKTLKNIEKLIQNLSAIKFEESFDIKELVLYKSTLTKNGPIYEKIFSSSLTA